MFAEEEAVIGAEKHGGLVGNLLTIEFVPDRAHIAVVVFDAGVVIFD